MLKTRRGGYDGKGQFVLRERDDADAAFAALGGVPLILEAFVPFTREVSVLAARGLDGEVRVLPLVENMHRDGILRVSRAPAPGLDAASQVAGEAIASSSSTTSTTWACSRSSCSMPTGGRDPAARERDGAARAQLGALDHRRRGDEPVRAAPARRARVATRFDRAAAGTRRCAMQSARCPPREAVLAVPGARLHDYGKEPRPGRKVGHVTVVADSADELETRLGRAARDRAGTLGSRATLCAT